MKHSRLFAACAATALLFCSSAFAANKIKNPAYDNWAKFKVGATAKLEGVSKIMGNENKTTTIFKLVEITPDKAVVEIAMSMGAMGQMPAQKQEIPATIDAPSTLPAPAPDAPKVEAPKTSEETVKVGDKEIKCKVTESTTDANGVKGTTKSWTSDEVPGMNVKMEITTSAPVESTTTSTLVEFTTGG